MIHEVFIYLRVRDGAKAIEFYKQAFGASEIFRLTEPGGRLGHAELDFGGTTIMVSDEFPEMNILGPESIGGRSAGVPFHVGNADACIPQGLFAGARLGFSIPLGIAGSSGIALKNWIPQKCKEGMTPCFRSPTKTIIGAAAPHSFPV